MTPGLRVPVALNRAAVEKSLLITPRWRRIAKAGGIYYSVEIISDALIDELFAPNEALQISPLGRGGGGHFVHPELGPVRLKIYRRGGLFGTLFSQCGLDEAAASRELAAEFTLSGAGIATQETLALCARSVAPKLRAIQRYFPDEVTYAELLAQEKLTDTQRRSAEELLEKITAAGYLHRDANGGNLLWNEKASRWRLIDLASARPLDGMNPARALEQMRVRLAKPPRAYR